MKRIQDIIFTHRKLALLLLVTTGFILRLFKMYETQLYRDEIYDIFWSAESSFMQLVFYRYWDSFHPPLYYILLKYWQMISINPFFIRLPGAILSILSMACIYRIAQLLYPKSIKFSFIILICFIVSNTQLTMNILARQYALALPLMLVSLLLFIFIIKQKGSLNPQLIMLFVIVTILSFLSDYASIWLILAYCMFVPCLKLNKLSYRYLLPLFFVGLFIIIWGGVLMVDKLAFFSSILNKGYPVNGFSVITNIASNIDWFTGINLSNFAIKRLFDPSYISLLLFIVSGIALISYSKKNIIFLLFFIILVAPVLLSLFITKFFMFIFIMRNLVIVNIAFIFGFSLIIVWLLEKQNIKLCLVVSVVILLYISNCFFTFNRLFYQEYYDWRGITHFFHQYQQSHGNTLLISIDPIYMFEPIRYYSNLYQYGNLNPVSFDSFIKLNYSQKNILFVDFLGEHPNLPNMEEYMNKTKGLHCRAPVRASLFINIKLLECNNKNE